MICVAGTERIPYQEEPVCWGLVWGLGVLGFRASGFGALGSGTP